MWGCVPFITRKRLFQRVALQRSLQMFQLRQGRQRSALYHGARADVLLQTLKFLAREHSIRSEGARAEQRRERGSECTRKYVYRQRFCARLFSEHTENHIDGRSIGMAYFRQRSFRDDTIEKFQLGFSLEQHDALAQEAI